MNKDMQDIINMCIKNSSYMDIERSNIDDELIGGFPLCVTDQFLIISKIYDFRNDGVTLLRIKDITSISPFGHRTFIENICKAEGLDKIQNPYKNLNSLYDVLLNIDTNKQYITIQCENYDNDLYFSIGKILKVAEEYVYMKVFDTEGIWDNIAREIPYKDITLISINDNYSNMFYKYMNKISAQSNSK